MLCELLPRPDRCVVGSHLLSGGHRGPFPSDTAEVVYPRCHSFCEETPRRPCRPIIGAFRFPKPGKRRPNNATGGGLRTTVRVDVVPIGRVYGVSVTAQTLPGDVTTVAAMTSTATRTPFVASSVVLSTTATGLFTLSATSTAAGSNT